MSQNRIVQIDPQQAHDCVNALCLHVGWETPREMFTRDEVVQLLHLAEYDVTPRTLTEFAEKMYVADFGETWDCIAVFALASALESRRRWKSAPSRHDAKKSGARLLLERIAADGVQPVNDLDQFTLEDLHLRLVGCDNRAQRECIYEAIRLKLAGLEE